MLLSEFAETCTGVTTLDIHKLKKEVLRLQVISNNKENN